MRRSFLLLLVVSFAALAGVLGRTQAQNPAAVAIDADDIGGVVSSSKGPEAGVWVIAETSGLPTKFRKIVVTDDQGRYLIPDLPRATYTVWVRGYGLVDSAKAQASPGRSLNLTARVAPDPRAAADYYPANYWYSLINVPGKDQFPGTGARGNGIGPGITSQAHWVSGMKANCGVCHQLGNKATREIPEALGRFPTTEAAWDRRVQTGLNGSSMTAAFAALGRPTALAMFAN